MEPDASTIAFDDVAVSRNSRMLWSQASFKVATGNFVAVLGPNGAGKSSMLSVVLGQLRADRGSITVLGGGPGDQKYRIGFLPQRRTFERAVRLSGRDVVHFGIDGVRWGVPLPFVASAKRKRDEESVEQVLELVGASQYAHQPIGEVSGGEQQRLLIAQALVQSPDLLLLDEPLDSLDLPNQHAIASLVRSVSQSRGTTVMMVAHDVNPILPYLDQVIYVAGGRIVSGTPEDVIRTDVLSDLYGVPVDVLATSDGRKVVVGAPDGHTHHAHR